MENLNINKNKICPICKTPYVPKEIKVMNMATIIMVAACECEKIAQETEEEKKRQELIKNNTERIFNNSLMSPFFREKTFDKLKRNKNVEFCIKYAENFEPKKSKGLQFIGEVGTGKTTLLAAISNDLMYRGYNCLFVTMSALLDDFAQYSYEHRGISDLLNWLTKFDFVVLDDIGRETYTEKRIEFVFRIVDALMNSKVTTSISANPDMIEKLKLTKGMDATIDRLKVLCPISIQFKGKSYRDR